MTNPCFDHVGLTVLDLDATVAFFTGLGLEPEGDRWIIEGEFVSTVVGIPDVRVEGIMLATPDGGTKLELSQWLQPQEGLEPQALRPTQPGLTNICFEVDDLRATLDRLAADGYGLVGGVGEYEETWRMAYVRGPEGIIVSLAEALG